MRSDVDKIISKWPKSGRTWKSKTPARSRLCLTFMEIRRTRTPTTRGKDRQKYRSPRYNVLERFLIHRVGRTWDKV